MQNEDREDPDQPAHRQNLMKDFAVYEYFYSI